MSAIPGWGGGGSGTVAPSNTGGSGDHSNVEIFGTSSDGLMRSVLVDTSRRIITAVSDIGNAATEATLTTVNGNVNSTNTKLDTVNNSLTTATGLLTDLKTRVPEKGTALSAAAMPVVLATDDGQVGTLVNNTGQTNTELNLLGGKLTTINTNTQNTWNVLDAFVTDPSYPTGNPVDGTEGTCMSVILSSDEPLRGLTSQLPAARGPADKDGSLPVTFATDDAQVGTLVTNTGQTNTELNLLGGKLTTINTNTLNTVNALEACITDPVANPTGNPVGSNDGTCFSVILSPDEPLRGTSSSAASSLTTLNTKVDTLLSRLPAALGETTKTGCLPVVLASDSGSSSEVSLSTGHGLALEAFQQKALATRGIASGDSIVIPFACTTISGNMRIAGASADISTMFKPPTSGSVMVWFLEVTVGMLGKRVFFEGVDKSGNLQSDSALVIDIGGGVYAAEPLTEFAFVNRVGTGEAGDTAADAFLPGTTLSFTGTCTLKVTNTPDGGSATTYTIFTYNGTSDSVFIVQGAGERQLGAVAVPNGYKGYITNLSFAAPGGSYMQFTAAAVNIASGTYTANATRLWTGRFNLGDSCVNGPAVIGPAGPGSILYHTLRTGLITGSSGQFVLVKD